MLRIHVPATSANIGPGFDSLGVALSLGNDFLVEQAERTSVSGCEEKYSGPDNLFLRAMRHASDLLGLRTPGVALRIDARIPLARGLGSSAAMIVGGIAAAVLLDERRGEGLPLASGERHFILDAAATMEGHPDNVAPAIFGGFCVSIEAEAPREENSTRAGNSAPRILCSRSSIDPDWGFHALIPPFELPTREARAALPATLPRADAVYNLGRAALVALAFEKKDAAMLGAACGDKLHQPYRKGLIPGYDAVTEACRDAGAVAIWLSGAGPTILALTVGNMAAERFSIAIAPVLASRPEGPWRQETLRADQDGLTWTPERI
ncbi:MAG: homoserine kinase [Spirochaetales bacterium]|jgi:homoserine kinase